MRTFRRSAFYTDRPAADELKAIRVRWAGGSGRCCEEAPGSSTRVFKSAGESTTQAAVAPRPGPRYTDRRWACCAIVVG